MIKKLGDYNHLNPEQQIIIEQAITDGDLYLANALIEHFDMANSLGGA